MTTRREYLSVAAGGIAVGTAGCFTDDDAGADANGVGDATDNGTGNEEEPEAPESVGDETADDDGPEGAETADDAPDSDDASNGDDRDLEVRVVDKLATDAELVGETYIEDHDIFRAEVQNTGAITGQVTAGLYIKETEDAPLPEYPTRDDSIVHEDVTQIRNRSREVEEGEIGVFDLTQSAADLEGWGFVVDGSTHGARLENRSSDVVTVEMVLRYTHYEGHEATTVPRRADIEPGETTLLTSALNRRPGTDWSVELSGL